MQGSNLGQVIGPLTVGGAIDRYGWTSASFIVAAAGLGGVLLAWRRDAWRPAGLQAAPPDAPVSRRRHIMGLVLRGALMHTPALAWSFSIATASDR